MKCGKCQFENPAGTKFCVECGAKLEINCPSCNVSKSPDYKFCRECGHDLRKPKETKPLDYNQPHACAAKHLALV